MFSPALRERLRLGKYSRWAVDLDEAQLEALIWMVGEYGCRAFYVLPLLKSLWNEEGSGRAVLALESMFRMVHGDRPDWGASSERVRDFLAEVRGYAESLHPPAHNWPIEWRDRHVGWLVDPVLNDSGTICSGVWSPQDEGEKFEFPAVDFSSPGREEIKVGGIKAVIKTMPDESNKVEFWL